MYYNIGTPLSSILIYPLQRVFSPKIEVSLFMLLYIGTHTEIRRKEQIYPQFQNAVGTLDLYSILYLSKNLDKPFDYQVICVTFTTLWASSKDDKIMIFSYFSQKIGFDISCKLSP